jgi:hypothetical protein
MPKATRHQLLFCPATIAIHDNADVTGY